MEPRSDQVVYRYVDLDWVDSALSPGLGQQGRLFHTQVCAELVSAPSLGHLGVKDPDDASRKVVDIARRVLRSLCAEPNGFVAELRYLIEPNALGTVRLFLLLRAQDVIEERCIRRVDSAMSQALTLLSPAYQWRRVAPAESRPSFLNDLPICEIRKNEQTIAVKSDEAIEAGGGYYYIPYPYSGDGSGWRDFSDLLSTVEGPAFVSLAFMPARLRTDEIDFLEDLTNALQDVSDYELAAKTSLDSWLPYKDSSDQGVLFRASVIASEADGAIDTLSRGLASALSAQRERSDRTSVGSSWKRPVVTKPATEAEDSWARWLVNNATVGPWGGHEIWHREDTRPPDTVVRLPYYFGLDWVGGAFILPTPDQNGCRGFSTTKESSSVRSSTARFEKVADSVSVGQLLEEGAAGPNFALSLAEINRHVLVVGSPGSGKTTTVLTLLANLWRDHRIPFLVIEPVKTEYRALAGLKGFEDALVFTVGKEMVSPIRLNPLEVPPRVARVVHQGTVLAAIGAAFNLEPPLPQILERALDELYRAFGWSEDQEPADNLKSPTIADLVTSIEIQGANLQYSAEVKGNVLEALLTRVKSLSSGVLGRTLATSESYPWDEILSRPTVIELDALAEADKKAAATSFILRRLERELKNRGSSSGKLRHVTVVEEAHQLLSAKPAPGSAQAQAVELLCGAIAELRNLGEGFIIADQQPGQLAPSAIANCASRFLHQLASSADREMLLRDADATSDMGRVSARLDVGMAVLTRTGKPAELLQITKPDDIDTAVPITDEVVQERSALRRAKIQTLLPTSYCSKSICAKGCDPSVRQSAERLADQELRAYRALRIGDAKPSEKSTAEQLKALEGELINRVAATAAGQGSRDTAFSYCSVRSAFAGTELTRRAALSVEHETYVGGLLKLANISRGGGKNDG